MKHYQNNGLAIQNSTQERDSNNTGSNNTLTPGGVEVDTEHLGSPTRQVPLLNQNPQRYEQTYSNP